MQKYSLKNLFNNHIFQSLLFGAVITALVAQVWDVPLEKYQLQTTGDIYNSRATGQLWFFGDFEGDGNTEKLRCHMDVLSNSRFSIVSYSEENIIESVLHFEKDFWTPSLVPALADVNNDKIDDFIFLSTIKDSVFFTAVDVVNEKRIIDHLFFKKIERFSENMAMQSIFYTESLRFSDRNKELLFYFDSGYGLYPRGLFKLNLQTLEFTFPEKTYSPLKANHFKDITGDDIPEIFTSTYAPSNVNFLAQFPDTQSYIVVYDFNFNYLFPPVHAGGKYSSVETCPASVSDTFFYALIQQNEKINRPGQVMCISQNGKIINHKIIPEHNTDLHHVFLEIINDEPYFYIQGFGYYKLDPELKNIPNELNESDVTKIFDLVAILDLNNDGWDELVYLKPDKTFGIINSKNGYPVDLKLPIDRNYRVQIIPYYKNGKIVSYIFSSGAAYFFFTYSENQFYFLAYLIYLGLFIFFSGITFLLLYLQKKQLEKNWHTEKQLSELQFNAVKNQLHPHFLFNSLNSVAYMINNGQKDEAYDFLTVNSRMIQRVMDDARVVQRPLNAEIQFTKDYLKVQEHRFKDKFRSEFQIHPEVDLKFSVPKMCIHTYVENAIKHGFRNTKKDGLLQINIKPLPAGVSITIADNGMGRKEAAKYDDSSGHGLKTMEEFYRLFEKYHGYKIDLQIKDLIPEKDNQTGMCVELRIQKEE